MTIILGPAHGSVAGNRGEGEFLHGEASAATSRAIPARLEEVFDRWLELLEAGRWVLLIPSGKSFSTETRSPVPRDYVYVGMAAGISSRGHGWVLEESVDLGDVGLRLELGGVSRALFLSTSLHGAPAVVVFEDPSLEGARRFQSEEAPSALELVEESAGDEPTEGLGAWTRRSHETQWLWAWLPALGEIAAGTRDELGALLRLGELSDGRAAAAALPAGRGARFLSARKTSSGWEAEEGTLDDPWEGIAAAPAESLDRAFEAVTGAKETTPWSVAWAVGNAPLILGVVPEGRPPSREALDLAATLLASALGQSADTSAARRHALLQERSRIASMIHEGLTQVVTNVALQLQVLERVLDNPARAEEMVKSSREAVTHALEDLRGAIFELAPREGGSTDLTGGLERYIGDFGAQWGIDLVLRVEGEAREVDAETLALIFGFVQEGLTNVRKHSEATEAEIRAEFAEDGLRVEVSDPGRGFDTARHPENGFRQHMGLSLLRSRAWLMGGTIDVDSAPGAGTRLTLRCPSQG